MVQAKWNEDQHYYKATILAVLPNGRYKVRYIYDDIRQEISRDRIKLLPDVLGQQKKDVKARIVLMTQKASHTKHKKVLKRVKTFSRSSSCEPEHETFEEDMDVQNTQKKEVDQTTDLDDLPAVLTNDCFLLRENLTEKELLQIHHIHHIMIKR